MKHKGIKILTVLMAAVMLFSALPVNILAQEIQQTVQTVSEMRNDPGYLEIKDGYVLVQVSKTNGGFYIGTETGDKLTKSDDNKNLLYPDANFDTSFTSFRVTRGGVTKDYVFGRDYSYKGVSCEGIVVEQSADNAIKATWAVDGLRFEQTIALMGADTNQHGMAYISYNVTETSGAAVENVEARVMMDTALGYQDHAIYMLGHNDGSYTTVDAERTVDGTFYNNYFFAYDSKTAPTVTAYTLNASVAGEVIVPTKVTFAHWNNLAASVFDYAPSTEAPVDFTDPYNLEYMTADSAVALYYSMGSVAANGSGKHVGLYYGVYSNHTATDGKVAMNFVTSGNMILNDEATDYKDLNGTLPGNYSTTLKIQNTGDSTLSKVAVAVYPGEEVYPYNENKLVTDVNAHKPFYKTVTDLRADEARDVRFDFSIDPTYVSDYRKIKVVIYDISSQDTFTETNTLLTKEFYVLCPATDNAEIGFTGMTPDAVFTSGRRYAYITGSNFKLLRDKSQYRILLRPMDGGDDVVLDQDLVVIDAGRNAVTLVLDQELRKGTWQVIIDWNDAAVEDIYSDALRLNVTDVPQPGDPGFVSAGVYGIVTVERQGNGTSEPYHYELVRYDSEEAYKNTSTERKNIMLVFRGDFNVLSSEERGVFKAEALTLMEGDMITVNDALTVKEGRVTVSVNFNDEGKQTDITVDIDGDVRTTGANTKVWNGICALTELKEGKLYTLPTYSEDGDPGYFPNEEFGETISLIWPGAENAAQTIAGLLLDLRYGELAVMKQADGSYANIIAFGAKLSPNFLVPSGTAATAMKDSKMERDLRSLGYGNYTARQLRSTYTSYEREQREWRNEQRGTLNLYMDDILFGQKGFIGFNTAIEIGIPSYTDGMPYIEGTLTLKVINDEWELGVAGSADLMVFEMEAELYIKSYNGFPIADKIYFHIGGVKPGIPVDPFGIFWVRGAGAGVDNIYESFFLSDRIPPLTLMLSGEFALFNVLSARADVSLSLHGIAASLSNIGIGGVTIIDSLGGSVYWYPNLNMSFAIRVDIFDILVGEGAIALRYDYDTKEVFFQAYAKVTVKIPDKIFLIGGTKIGEATLGIDTHKVWAGVKVIGIGVAIIYYWGGDVDVKVGKKAKLPDPVMPASFTTAGVAYTEGGMSETVYMELTNNIRLLGASDSAVAVEDSIITSSQDMMTHRFVLDSKADEDGLLTVTYPADNLLAAEDLKHRIKVTAGGNAYDLVWFDKQYEADHPANLGTNAILSYDDTTGMATASISFTTGDMFDTEITVETPVASDLLLYGIERLVDFDTLTLSEDRTKVTLTGKDLAKLSELSINAADENGAIYRLAEVDVSAITGDTVEIPLTYPGNLPTGSYSIQAVGTLMDASGEYEIAKPMIEIGMEHVNPDQPAPVTSAKLTVGGNYRINMDLTAADADYDGYVTNIYEVGENGELISTVFRDVYTELTEEEKAAGPDRSILLGGRYAATDPATGEVTYNGLEEGKAYKVTVQTYKNMDDGSRLLSSVVLTDALEMVAPVETKPVLSIEGAVKTEVGGSTLAIDAVASKNVTVKVDGVGTIRSGSYTLGNGESVEWDGGDITLTDLEDGVYTLRLTGVNETNDSFGTLYQFSVDTEAPGILVSSPQGGGFFEGDYVEVTGITEANAKIVALAEDGTTVTGRASETGDFSILVPVNYAMAYQDIKVYAQDALGNQSMPFGCTLTNILMSDPNLKAVILLDGEEVTKLESTATPQQLSMALKSGDDYIMINQNSAAAARVLWSATAVESSISVTDDGVLTGAPGAVGIVTVALDQYSAMAELQPTDLSSVRATLTLPETPYVYDGTPKTPAVEIRAPGLTEGTDYRVTYMSNVNAGTAVAVITAVEGSNCVGIKMLEFTINAQSISSATATVADDGSQKPAVTVTFGGKTLTEGTDYTLTYLISADESKGIAVIYGIGNYKNVLNQVYSIPAPETEPSEPGTDTSEPETTTGEPDTTIEPDTTTEEPDTTIEPDTTTGDPETTIEPETTTGEPETTTDPETETNEPSVSVKDTVISSSDDMRKHSFTLDGEAEDNAVLSIRYPAGNAEEATALKEEIVVSHSGQELELVWFDPDYSADHEANKNANAKLTFDAKTGVASVELLLDDRSVYGSEIKVDTPVAAVLEIAGVERAPETTPDTTPDTDPDTNPDTEPDTGVGNGGSDEDGASLGWIIPVAFIGVCGIAVALYFWFKKKKGGEVGTAESAPEMPEAPTEPEAAEEDITPAEDAEENDTEPAPVEETATEAETEDASEVQETTSETQDTAADDENEAVEATEPEASDSELTNENGEIPEESPEEAASEELATEPEAETDEASEEIKKETPPEA